MGGRLSVGRVSGNRPLNADKAPGLFGTLPGKDRAIAFGEWKLPQDVAAHRKSGEVSLTSLGGFSKQAHIRMRASRGQRNLNRNWFSTKIAKSRL